MGFYLIHRVPGPDTCQLASSNTFFLASICSITYCTPELRIASARDDCSFTVRTKNPFYCPECTDDLLAVPGVQPVLRWLLHGDDEHIAVSLE